MTLHCRSCGSGNGHTADCKAPKCVLCGIRRQSDEKRGMCMRCYLQAPKRVKKTRQCHWYAREPAEVKPVRQLADPPCRCLWCFRWRCWRPLQLCGECQEWYDKRCGNMPNPLDRDEYDSRKKG